MDKFFKPISALMLAAFSVGAQAQLFENKPDVLVCSVSQISPSDEWQQFVFYVSGSRKDGAVLYKSLFSNPALISIDSKGLVSAPNLADCDGKNVEELYESGRAENFGK
jgi:hypothetical protein